MADEFSDAGKIRLQNPDSLSRIIEKKLPKTVIEKTPKVNAAAVYNSANEIEEKILSDYLVEHFQDIGGWKGKNYLSIEDLDKIPPYKKYLPSEVQKFTVEERLLPDSIFDPLPQPDVFSLISSYQSTKAVEVPTKAAESPNKPNPSQYLEESEFERMIKLKTKNKKVFSIVDDFLNRSKKKRSAYSRNY